jgi:L-ascorbate metabolism protein UlaG (beta-lactamase superfamily)
MSAIVTLATGAGRRTGRFVLALTALMGIVSDSGRARDPAADIYRFRSYVLEAADGPPKDGAVKVTYFGTTTLLFDDGETQILIDGFFTRPRMLRVAAGKIQTDPTIVDAVLKRAKVDRLKAVFVAHSHYDHALDVAYVCKATDATLYGSPSTLNVGRGGGVPEGRMISFDPKKDVTIGTFIVTVRTSSHTPPLLGVNDDLGRTIDQPLKQPANAKDYKEGGSFEFRIRHGNKTMLVLPGGGLIEGERDNDRADVLFLGTAGLGMQTDAFRRTYYEQTVAKLRPKLVVPIHWDNFFRPLSDRLEPPGKPIDDLPAGFDFLTGRLKADGIRFGIMQGYGSVMVPGS